MTDAKALAEFRAAVGEEEFNRLIQGAEIKRLAAGNARAATADVELDADSLANIEAAARKIEDILSRNGRGK